MASGAIAKAGDGITSQSDCPPTAWPGCCWVSPRGAKPGQAEGSQRRGWSDSPEDGDLERRGPDPPCFAPVLGLGPMWMTWSSWDTPVSGTALRKPSFSSSPTPSCRAALRARPCSPHTSSARAHAAPRKGCPRPSCWPWTSWSTGPSAVPAGLCPAPSTSSTRR